ncbi:MAG: YHS domain-containing (seleno)protein [Bacteroidota bacterium]
MKLISLQLLTLFFAIIVHAQEGHFYNSNGIAIKGYDPVAYFTQNKAVVGNDSISMEWSGSIWKFVSKENLQLFTNDPKKYAPVYGGFCAYGTSEKHLSPTDPNAWTIVNNKLYLNYNLKVKEFWIKDTTSRIISADTYWSGLKN